MRFVRATWLPAVMLIVASAAVLAKLSLLEVVVIAGCLGIGGLLFDRRVEARRRATKNQLERRSTDL